MSRRHGRVPVRTAGVGFVGVWMVVLFLTATACGGSGRDSAHDETSTTTVKINSTNAEIPDPAPSSAPSVGAGTAPTNTSVTTTIPVAATDGNTTTSSTPTSSAPPTTSAAPTNSVVATTSSAPTTSAPTTTTTAPAAAVVSPWPSDPRTTDDREWRVKIEASWSHDTDAFTQGLETDGGTIYESTGLYGGSRLRALDGADELRSVAIDSELFGEGLTLVGDEIIQLTWREGRALRWDRETFEPRGEFRYQGEGWGICWDQVGSRLLMSDGTSTLTHRNAEDFTVVATTVIRRDNEPVSRINELECVEEFVVANLWMTNEIIVVDPDSGEVLVSIDAASLAAAADIPADEHNEVLNGVAYRGDGKWILGGKNWPLQFLVTLTLN